MKTEIVKRAQIMGDLLAQRGYTISTAESCTGGGIAAAITEVAGSSDWFHYGFVVYHNRAKEQLLNVPKQLLDKYGAVSEPVVAAMLEGSKQATDSEVAIAVSGIAGPSGGSAEKPIGTVFIGCCIKELCSIEEHQFQGDRTQIRQQVVLQALEATIAALTATEII